MTGDTQRKAALAILTSDTPLTRKAGSFLGQCAADPAPLTERQQTWFQQLAEKAGLEVQTDAA